MSVSDVILIAFGGLLAIEGVFWAVFPAQTRAMYQQIFQSEDLKALHIAGLISVAIGTALIALAIKF